MYRYSCQNNHHEDRYEICDQVETSRWPLDGLCGTWGGIAVGIFGSTTLGGMGGVSFMSQLIGTGMGITVALIGGFTIYGLLKAFVGIRLSEENEVMGADLSIHKITATPKYD